MVGSYVVFSYKNEIIKTVTMFVNMTVQPFKMIWDKVLMRVIWAI